MFELLAKADLELMGIYFSSQQKRVQKHQKRKVLLTLFRTTSATLSPTATPPALRNSSANIVVASLLTSYTTRESPSASPFLRLTAMGYPIFPSPMKP